MAWQKSSPPVALLSLGLFLELLLLSNWLTPVQAQSESAFPIQIVRISFDPPGDSRPQDTAGGASRHGGICPQDSANLNPSDTPFTIATNQGLTVAERPTFFVYVPPTSAQQAMFVLKDENEDYYYQKTLPIANTSGVISFRLPADAPTLEMGKNYQWSLVLMCTATLRPDSPRVEGQIQRIEPNPTLISQIEQWSPLDRAAFYGKDGI
ncbi:MAG TPA: hypothetical protein DDZ80_28720 [Cyanobacteria bacterium UBA8803]|nr:hypothetical protein [Cyanobacteria bacterium UBA9273]HBL62240.1 hypothetical protein [Cyanobacteria bacterium UBA8803]